MGQPAPKPPKRKERNTVHFDFNLTHLSIDPASVVATWVSICAAVSLLNKYVVAPLSPMAAKIIALPLNILPAHVGQLITDIEAIIADIKGGSASGGGSGTAPPADPPIAKPPTNARMGLAAFGFATIFAVQTIAFGAAVTGCTPAQQAEAQSLEQLVLHDIQLGKGEQAIEADIAAQLAGQPGVDVVIVLNDILQFLIDAGVVPADLVSNTLALKASVAPKAAAHRAAK